MRLWDARAGKQVTTYHGHQDQVNAVRFHWNGNWLASAGKDATVRLFEVRMNRELQRFLGHRKDVNTIAWHPTHESLFVTGAPSTGSECLPASAQVLARRACDGGSTALAGGADDSIMHWLVDEESPLSESKEVHGGSVTCLAWHPVGHLLCSVGVDASVKFWTRSRPGDALLGHLTTATLGPDQQVQTAAQAAAGLPAAPEAPALAIPGLSKPAAVAPPVAPPRPPSGPPVGAQGAVKSELAAAAPPPQPAWATPMTFDRQRANGGLPPPPGAGRGRMGSQARGRSGRFGRGGTGAPAPNDDGGRGGYFDRSRDGPSAVPPGEGMPQRRDGGFGWAPLSPYGGPEAQGPPAQQPGYGGPERGPGDYGGRGWDGGRCALRGRHLQDEAHCTAPCMAKKAATLSTGMAVTRMTPSSWCAVAQRCVVCRRGRGRWGGRGR